MKIRNETLRNIAFWLAPTTDDDKWQHVQETISEDEPRWGNRYVLIIQHKESGKFYRHVYQSDGNAGWDDFEDHDEFIELTEVKPVAITQVTYVPVEGE